MPSPVKRVKQSNNVYVGVDPGQAGGVAVIGLSGEVDVFPMPETELEIWQLFDGIGAGVQACLEKVHSMPKQGVASSFKFGQNYGLVRMALTAAGMVWEEVTPQVWQKGLAIPQEKDNRERKNKLKAHAQRLFPRLSIWNEPKSIGRQKAVCDALLIAEYHRRKCEGRL